MTTIQQKLDAMPMEDFEVLLKRVAGVTEPGYQSQETIPDQHAELLSELECQGKVKAEEPRARLRSGKYSSSLQSLSAGGERGEEGWAPKAPSPHGPHPAQQKKSYQLPHHTLPTINSNSSLNSIGVEGGPEPHPHTPDHTSPLPPTYFFNERDPEPSIPNGALEEEKCGSGQVQPSSSSFDTPSDFSSHGANNARLELSEEYSSVASLTGSLVTPTKSSNPVGELTRCLTPNFPSHNQPMLITKSPSEGSNADRTTRRGPGDRNVGKRKANKAISGTLIDIEKLPGFRGTDDIENLVQFVEGTFSTSTSKRGKKKESRTKEKETLVKSASLDENHLNDNTKRSSEEQLSELPSSGPLSSTSLTTTTTNSNSMSKVVVGRIMNRSVSQNLRKCEDEEASDQQPFELVQSKKRRTKRSSTQREADTFSRGKATEQSRREQTRSRRNAGDRRKSVGSVPGSENSDGSDDDSVRSLPAGECTPKERIPKQCASSGGTPQTSYADIARMTDGSKGSPPINNNNSSSAVAGMSTSTTHQSSRELQSDEPTEMANRIESPPAPSYKLKSKSVQITSDCQQQDIMNRGKPPDSSTISLNNISPPRQENNMELGVGKKGSQVKCQTYETTVPSENVRHHQQHKGLGQSHKMEEKRTDGPTVPVTVNGEGSGVPIQDKTEFPYITIANADKYRGVPFADRNQHKKQQGSYQSNQELGRKPTVVKRSTAATAALGQENKSSSNPPLQINKAAPDNGLEPQFQKSNKQVLRVPPRQQSSTTDESGGLPMELTEGLVEVNGDFNEQGQRGSSRDSSNLHIAPDVPVVFCGGNFEQDLPSGQDVGFEFGFDVMSAMTHFPSPQTDMSEERREEEGSSCLEKPVATVAGTQSRVEEESEEPTDFRVPERWDSSGGGGKERYRLQQPRESLLGSYHEPQFDSRRPQQQFAHPRLPRLPHSTFRPHHQRNGGMYLSQPHGQPGPYSVHVPSSGTGAPQPMVHQPMFGPPQMVSPHSGFTQGALVSASPYGQAPGNIPRGLLSMAGQPNQQYMMMYNVPHPQQLPPHTDEGMTLLSPSTSSLTSPVEVSIATPPSLPPSSRPLFYQPNLPPQGPICGQLYLAPHFNYPVPVPTHEVEHWMNSHVQRAYNLGAQGQLNVYRIDELI